MHNGVTKGYGASSFAGLKSANINAMYQAYKNLYTDIENNTEDAYIANLAKECEEY